MRVADAGVSKKGSWGDNGCPNCQALQEQLDKYQNKSWAKDVRDKHWKSLRETANAIVVNKDSRWTGIIHLAEAKGDIKPVQALKHGFRRIASQVRRMCASSRF